MMTRKFEAYRMKLIQSTFRELFKKIYTFTGRET